MPALRQLLLTAVACDGARLHRSPSGPAATAWATAHAPAFRNLDALGFPPSGLWSERQYVSELSNKASEMLTVWDGDALLAFVCSEKVLDETHLLSLTVHPAWRGRGLARTLVLASLWAARAAGQRMITLEVRASNCAAIELYASCGMRCIGRRPKYYKRPPPTEDALLLARDFEVECGGGAAAASDSDEGADALAVPIETLISARSMEAAEAIRRAALSPYGSGLDRASAGVMTHGELLGELPLLELPRVYDT